MNKKLEIQKQILNDCVKIDLIGNIDEDSDFSELISLKQKEYKFNFNEINLINSCGIREWINFLGELDEDVRIIYENCPQIVIEQMNMVHGFIKQGSKIESFYAPYFCEECDKEKKILIKSENVQNQKAPSVNCDQCNKRMEFDDIEEQYFNFLKKK